MLTANGGRANSTIRKSHAGKIKKKSPEKKPVMKIDIFENCLIQYNEQHPCSPIFASLDLQRIALEGDCGQRGDKGYWGGVSMELSFMLRKTHRK